jgi:hypothetical protein
MSFLTAAGSMRFTVWPSIWPSVVITGAVWKVRFFPVRLFISVAKLRICQSESVMMYFFATLSRLVRLPMLVKMPWCSSFQIT